MTIESLRKSLDEFFYRTDAKKKEASQEKSRQVLENSELLVRLFHEAAANNVSAIVDDKIGWNASAAKMFPHPHIVIPHITSRRNFVGAMHELGHLVGKWQDFKTNTLLEMEAGAWLWAREHIHDWTVEDGQFRRECLETYLKAAAELKAQGLTRHPYNQAIVFPGPPESHILWEMMRNDMV